MLRHPFEILGFLLGITAYTLIVMRISYAWGSREKDFRKDAPRPSALPRRQPGRHAAGFRGGAAGAMTAELEAAARKNLPARHPVSLLERVRDGLRNLSDDDPDEAPDPDDPQEARSPGYWQDEWPEMTAADEEPTEAWVGEIAGVPPETTEMTAITPVPEGLRR